MKTTNNRTLSRKLWEEQYKYISAVNPLIKIILPFEELLTEDMSKVKDKIMQATNVSITYDGYNTTNIPSTELQRVVLTEINDYGHSLVLVTKPVTEKTEVDICALSEKLFAHKQDINLNIIDEDYYIRLQGETAKVEFGSKEYECKHISIISETANTEVYMPTLEKKRMFVAEHSTPCRDCKNRKCIHNVNHSKISMYDSLSDKLVETPSIAYDMHKADCYVMKAAKSAYAILAYTLDIYDKQAMVYVGKSKTNKEVNVKNNDNEGKEDKQDVRVVKTNTEPKATDKEIWVSVRSAVTDSKRNYSTTHASPIAHSVDGYWRRRSKKDDTLIFVQSFARGGTKEERENINTSMKKQKVYKLE